jgi:hypothetical protein
MHLVLAALRGGLSAALQRNPSPQRYLNPLNAPYGDPVACLLAGR